MILSTYAKRAKGYALAQTLGAERVAKRRGGALVWVRGKDEG